MIYCNTDFRLELIALNYTIQCKTELYPTEVEIDDAIRLFFALELTFVRKMLIYVLILHKLEH